MSSSARPVRTQGRFGIYPPTGNRAMEGTLVVVSEGKVRGPESLLRWASDVSRIDIVTSSRVVGTYDDHT